MATIVVMHLAAAAVAVGLGIGILFIRRGTPRHRWLGRLWVAAMAATALSSFGIRGIGGIDGSGGTQLSWLHVLSSFVLVNLVLAVRAIRQGRVQSHRRRMLGLYAGLLIAGVAAVAVPGRALNRALVSLWQHDATQPQACANCARGVSGAGVRLAPTAPDAATESDNDKHGDSGTDGGIQGNTGTDGNTGIDKQAGPGQQTRSAHTARERLSVTTDPTHA
ncbi:hypothetical protein PMO31116_03421 [Pandoraea morbifera]|uniref:DUF2306 domain-containing protein n=1 Tax=Pandoraea morbifera TaxID=2508300 RepID=A0A5E4WRH6_9BURK|nr:DUF2306 domain-containing protein [Pandoraea morbifera]VVE27362.1 hypothetical protein PMO31116_03421 [Pandoraea morbifera]